MKQQVRSLSKHYLILGYFVFGIVIREIALLLGLLYMVLMVMFHMFPQGWFKAIVRELRDARKAYNDAFGKSFAESFKTKTTSSD